MSPDPTSSVPRTSIFKVAVLDLSHHDPTNNGSEKSDEVLDPVPKPRNSNPVIARIAPNAINPMSRNGFSEESCLIAPEGVLVFLSTAAELVISSARFVRSEWIPHGSSVSTPRKRHTRQPRWFPDISGEQGFAEPGAACFASDL
jgi:hypothetical protein